MARRKQETLVLFPDVMMGTKNMTDAQFGALMRAVFIYRFEGTDPEFEDPMVDMAFGFLRTQLDRYAAVSETNRKNKIKSQTEENTVEESGSEVFETNEVQRNATESHEMQRNATESHEMQRNPTHNHTHTHTHNHSHNHTRTRTHNHTHDRNHSRCHTHIDTVADKPPNDFFTPTVEEVRQYCTATGIRIDPQRFVDYYTANGWMLGRTKMKDWQAAVRIWNGKEKEDGKNDDSLGWTIGTVL